MFGTYSRRLGAPVRVFSTVWLLILGCSLYPGQAQAALDPATLQEILIREHGRDTSDGFLEGKTQDPDPAIRVRAFLALGRIQDEASLDILSAGLSDPNPAVRQEATFALGQLEIPETVPHLLTVIEDPDPLVRRYAIEGMGKANDETVVAKLAELLLSGDDIQAEAAATALGFAATRDINIRKVAREGLRQGVVHKNENVLWKSCFAVQRGKVKHVIFQYAYLLKHSNPLVRIYALKAIAASSALNQEKHLLPLLQDADWRVRVEALNAVSKTKNKTLVARMSLLLDDPNPNVRFATAQSLVALAYSAGLARFMDWRDSNDWRLRTAFLRGKTRSSGAGALADLFLASKDPNWHIRVVAAECLAEIGTNQSLIAVEPLVNDEHPSVQAAAINALVEFKEEAATKAIRPGLKSGDMTVLISAANGAGQRLDRDALPLLVEAYASLQSPFDTESMVAILEAIGTVLSARDEDGAVGSFEEADKTRALSLLESAFESPDYLVAARASESLALARGEAPIRVHRPPTLPEGFDAELAAQLELSDSPITAVIETRKGTITLELLPQVAPVTVANFTKLARDGYFDGLLFHRVVSNFVIQGGDPRGDGWGGPGYSIRCEYSPLPFTTGTVGMAHSGKDTAGSQFFITHSPMPHLEGRYTIFGQVTSGQEVVDDIQVGDVIQSIHIEGL